MITEDMITEDFVSFETAKLLKEKGFDGECIAYYSIYKDNNASLHRWRNRQTYVNVKNDGYTIVPTLQMAMKWLRKMHNLHIDAPITYQYLPRKYEAHIMHTEKHEDIVVNPGTNFNTNEEACEAAIKYCLENLI